MRALLLLASLLLSGCALLGPAPPPGGSEHDGYVLVCEGVATAACQRRADRHAARVAAEGQKVRWIIVRPNGFEVCWEVLSPLEPNCVRTGPREVVPAPSPG